MNDTWLYSKETGELYHYGILGMKWGQRRRQKKVSKIERKAKKQGWTNDALSVEKLKLKKNKELSNNELKQLNTRRELERKYKNDRSKAKKFVASAATVTAVVGAIGVYRNLGVSFVQAAMSN